MLVARLTLPRTGALRIGIDARSLNVDHRRGMGNYLSGVIGALAEAEGLDWRFFSDRPDLPFHNPVRGGEPTHRAFDCPGHRFHAWEQAALPAWALYRGIDVLHCPQNAAPWWQPVPTIVTLHDTLLWDGAEAMPHGRYRDAVLPGAFRRAAAIITISEQSKRDILRRWPELAEKLHVIPHGVEPAFLEIEPAPLGDALRAHGIVEPYLLYCGGLVARKRLDWALEIFAALGDPALQLVLCGVPRSQHAAAWAALGPKLRARVRLAPYLAAEVMPRLYQNAAAVLYPTLYEGFGFPALEAQAAGTPVLMSALGSLAELAGPGAVILEPEDREGWIAAAKAAVASWRAGRLPDEKARRWTRRFSWQASAASHLAIYRRAAHRAA